MEVRGKRCLVYTYDFVFGLERRVMGRQRSSTFEDIAVIVSRLPWWAGVILAIVFYVWMHHVATQPGSPPPADMKQMGESMVGQLWRTFALFLQYILPICCLLGAGLSAYRQYGSGRQSNVPGDVKRWSDTGTVSTQESSSRSNSRSTPDCPICGASMVRRVAKKGGNVGETFWGCSHFPQCRGTRPGA